MNRLFPILLCCLLAACSDATDPTGGQAAESVVPVTATLPVQRDIEVVLHALGSVESLQHPTVAAETAGRIVSLAASDGDTVRTGQVLANIDNTLHAIETAKAAAEVRRQRALAENQAREVARLTRLVKTQAVAEDQLEDEAAQLEVLEGQLDVARKQWEQAQHMEAKTRVLAPLDGVVSRRHVSVGDYVSVGQALFDLVEVDTLRARLAFPEHLAAQIRSGQAVSLSSPAAPDTTAVGRVTSINPQVSQDNRAVEVIVDFPNPGGWLPGSSVDASLAVQSRPGALTIPLLGVSRRNGEDVVFVLEDDRAVARPVELGWSEADWVEIASGLQPGERVVVDGVAQITSGSRVGVEEPAP